MLLVFFALTAGLSTTSCEEERKCRLGEEKLVEVLSDIQIAESAAQSLTGTVKDSVLQSYYGQILEIQGISREEFEICFRELQNDPERMNLLYDKVIEELNLQDAGGKKEKPEGQN